MGTCESVCESVVCAPASQPHGVSAHSEYLAETRTPRTSEFHLVAVNEIIQCRGSITIAGRYCTHRAFDSDFVVGKVLGEGMNGPVRLAKGKDDGKTYAVKSFMKGALAPHRLTQLKHEAEIYLCLDHPHVTPLNVVYESASSMHFVMEHMKGGELLHRLFKVGFYPEAEAAATTRQMARAVSYLHSHNIVHRDLKPENFMYENKRSSHLKLIDMGLARFWDGRSNMTWRCGSVPYAAPEVLAGSYTDKADLWSLGVIVYLLLVGTPPFPDGSRAAYPGSAAFGAPFRCRQYVQLSAHAKDLVEGLLEPDPALRFSARSVLLHRWLCSVGEGAAQTPPITHFLGTLRAYSRAPLLRRAVLSVMAWSLPADSDTTLRHQFIQMDVERTGAISHKVFKNMLMECFSVEMAEAEILFDSLDINGSDEIDYSEFLAGILSSCPASVPEDVLCRTFNKFDHDRNGLITADDLRHALGDCFRGARMDELIKEADVCGDGQISYPEFFSYFRKTATETECAGAPAHQAHELFQDRRTIDGVAYL